MKVWCLFGHKWKTYTTNVRRAVGLGALSTVAGDLSMCLRCGKIWDDFLHVRDDGELKHYGEKMEDLERDRKQLGLLP